MVARFHYDDAVFERLLQDRLRPDEQQDVTQHVEGCTSCQSKLEVLAEQGIRWEDVRNFLKDREQSETTRDSNQADSSSVWIGFLEPSERPDSLGRFGRYEILEVLGRGGTGIVMRGHDPSLDRQCAIKVLSPELAASAAARKRFSREAKSAAAVVHEHVVPIQTVDEEQGLPYLVMPVLEGRSLEDRVRKNGPLDVKEILRVGRQIASGLAAAHAQGLIHRDVKPANILLNHGVERVVITDFGLARAADDASMTQSGTLVGTPQYMSPEQAKGESLDVRSDLFSLGSVLYFMATGHSPFRADTTMGILNRITSDTPRSLTEHNPEIPPWFDQIVRKLLSKRPEDRYATAADVEKLLGDWLAHLQDPTRVPRPAEPKTSEGNGRSRIAKWIAAALGGIFLLWAGITVVLETGKGTLTIENHADDIAVRIKKGDKVYDQLTVKKGENKVRLAAGKYVVEFDGLHDGVTIENGAVTLTRGDQELVRIVEEGANVPNWGVRSDFHSDVAKIMGDWIEVESPEQADRVGPLRLRFQNGRYAFRWSTKTGDATVIQFISGKLTINTDQPTIKLHPTEGAHSATLETQHSLSGTYKFDGEDLVIEIDKAETPPDFLPGTLPATFRFKRSTESPATFITGNDNDLPPGTTIRWPQGWTPHRDTDLFVPTQKPLLSLADKFRPWLSFAGTTRPVFSKELDQLEGIWREVTDSQNANLAKALEIRANRLTLGWRKLKDDGQIYSKEVPGEVTLSPDNKGLTLTIYRPGPVSREHSTQQYFVDDRYQGTYLLEEGSLTVTLTSSEHGTSLAEQELPITWRFRREPQIQPYTLTDDTQWMLPEHLFPAAPEIWQMTEESWKPLPGVAPSEIQARLTSELQVSMTFPEEVGRGDSIRFTATISNKGEAPINQIEVSAYIGHHLKVISATGTPDQFPGRVLWKLNQIQPNEDVVLQYTCEQTQPFPQYHSELVITTQGNRKQLMARVRQKDYKYGPGNDSDMRADFSSDLVKLTGQWVEIQDPEQETTVDPLRLSLKNGRYAIPWTTKSDRNIVNLIGGGFTLHTNEPRILFHRSALPIDAPKDRSSVSTLHSFSGSYKFEDEQLLLTIDEVDGSPEFLPKELPTTYRFRRLSDSGSTYAKNPIEITPAHPPIEINLKGPRHAPIGQPIMFRATITNTGDQVIEGIVAREIVDPGLTVTGRTDPAEDKEKTIVWKVPRLLPNQSALFEVECLPKDEPGLFTNHLQVTVDELTAETAENVLVGPLPMDNAVGEEGVPVIRQGNIPAEDIWSFGAAPIPVGSTPDAKLPPELKEIQGRWIALKRIQENPGSDTNQPSELNLIDRTCQIIWKLDKPEDVTTNARKFWKAAVSKNFGIDMEQVQSIGPRNFSLLAQGINPNGGQTQVSGALLRNGDLLTITINHVENPTQEIANDPTTWRFRRAEPATPPANQESSLGEKYQQYQPKPAPVSSLQGTWNEITGVKSGEQTLHRPLRIQGDQMTISWNVMPPVSPKTGTMFFGASLASVDGKLTLDEKAGTFTYLAQKKASGELAAKKEFIFNFTLKGEFKLADDELTLNIKEAESAPPTLIQQDLPVTLRYRRNGTDPETPPKAKPKSEPIKSPLSDYLPLQGKWFEVVDDAERQATSRYGRRIIDFHREFYTLEQTELNEGINYAMTGPLQLEAGSSDKPVSMKFERIVKRESTAYPKNGEPYPIRVTYVEPIFSGDYRIDGDRLSISIREVHDENEFVEKVPVKLEFQRAPEGTAETTSSVIPLSISKQVEMEIDVWKQLQGSWMEVEDFNPRPDGIIGQSDFQPTSIRFQESVFTWQRFDDGEGYGKALVGRFRPKVSPEEGSSTIEFNCASLPAASNEIMPDDQFAYFTRRSLWGPIKIERDQLTIQLKDATLLPDYLGELPREWKFKRITPMTN